MKKQPCYLKLNNSFFYNHLLHQPLAALYSTTRQIATTWSQATQARRARQLRITCPPWALVGCQNTGLFHLLFGILFTFHLQYTNRDNNPLASLQRPCKSLAALQVEWLKIITYLETVIPLYRKIQLQQFVAGPCVLSKQHTSDTIGAHRIINPKSAASRSGPVLSASLQRPWTITTCYRYRPN